MHADANAEAERADGVPDRGCAADRSRRPVEPGGEETVAGGVNRLAPEARELAPDDRIVLLEQRRPRAARLQRSHGRVDEIGEQDRRENAAPLHRPLLPRIDLIASLWIAPLTAFF